MNNPMSLLRELSGFGVKLTVVGEDLRIHGMDPSAREHWLPIIAEHKRVLVELITESRFCPECRTMFIHEMIPPPCADSESGE